MNDCIMELRDATVSYGGDIAILDRLSLKAERGRIVGIIGPNGAGKSTALKTLYGFLTPQHGDVYLNGERITGLPTHAYVHRGVAYVPQNRSVFDDLSVEDNLRLGCWAFRKDKARIERGLEQAYARFPILKERRRQRAATLSGGQQRFLEFARALITEPRVVLLDEPTAMIAPRVSQELYEVIRRFPEEGITVILVDQNVKQCVRIADYIHVLELGRNKAQGTGEEFRQEGYLHEMIAEWLDYRID